MSNDFKPEADGPLFSSRRSRRRSAFPPVAILGIVILIAIAAGAAWIWLRPGETLPPPAPPVVDSTAPAMEEPFVLPPLGASDAAVRKLVTALSAHPQLATWLVTDDLARRFVEAVVDLSRGSSPAPAMEVLIPEEPFSVEHSGDRLVVGPESYRRYNLLADVFTSIDTEGAARAYRQLLPLFQEAYQELGYSDGSFQEVLARAVDNLLSVQVPAGPVEVKEAVGRYVYSDPALESLTPAEKHLLRLGPENARQVQAKLRAIAAELDLPVAGSAGAPGAQAPPGTAGARPDTSSGG